MEFRRVLFRSDARHADDHTVEGRNKPMNDANTPWPELPPPDAWADTFATVHMWVQIVGKIRLALSPWLNHSWGSTLHVTANGLTTSPIPAGESSFDIEFDFARSEEHTSELQSLMRTSYAVFCLKKKKTQQK